MTRDAKLFLTESFLLLCAAGGASLSWAVLDVGSRTATVHPPLANTVLALVLVTLALGIVAHTAGTRVSRAAGKLRVATAILALSLTIGFVVFWQQHRSGSAMTPSRIGLGVPAVIISLTGVVALWLSAWWLGRTRDGSGKSERSDPERSSR